MTTREEHLIAGLRKIIGMKDLKQYKSEFADMIGEPGADKDGWRDMPFYLRKGLMMAADEAQKILDTTPEE